MDKHKTEIKKQKKKKMMVEQHLFLVQGLFSSKVNQKYS